MKYFKYEDFHFTVPKFHHSSKNTSNKKQIKPSS